MQPATQAFFSCIFFRNMINTVTSINLFIIFLLYCFYLQLFMEQIECIFGQAKKASSLLWSYAVNFDRVYD